MLIHADCLNALRHLPDNSVDSVVTDPPYGLSFMGKKWDYDVPGVDIWRECLRVLKPGGYLLSFAGTRTQHRIACGIEDAGFEIRDMIAWVYGSGFPKSLNVGNGYGTALKPAHEPITVARKPIEGTVAANVLKWGTGAINIDGCRVDIDFNNDPDLRNSQATNTTIPIVGSDNGKHLGMHDRHNAQGRFPANLIHDGSDEVVGMFPETGKSSGGRIGNKGSALNMCGNEYEAGDPGFGDSGSAARFFYCAKASKAERQAGNNHPTVKPIALMRYLIKLVTPPNGTVLDPFLGSGTTAIAAVLEGREWIGIEREAEYCDIARARIAAAESQQLEMAL
jgi:DNA modification methylase